jgi:glycosyltransferase involved in cell wall biosynthesis
MAKRKKRILFIVNKKNYNIKNRNSAIDSIIFSVLKELCLDYDIVVNGKDFNSDTIINIRPLKTLSRKNVFYRITPSFLKQFFRDLKVFYENIILLNTLKKQIKPDFIFELMRYGSNLGYQLKRHLNVPFVVYFDSPAVEENFYLKSQRSIFTGLINKFESQTIIEADKVIVYSNVIRDYWQFRLKTINLLKFNVFQTLDYTRLNFVYNKKNNNPLNIGFVGSFLKWHRLNNLVEVFFRLRQNGFNIKLILIGSGEEYNVINKKVQESIWKDDVTLTGFIDGEKLIEMRNKLILG